MLSKKEAYICLSAMLRAREPKLLNEDRAYRMIDAPTADEAAKLLSESGYSSLSGRNAKELCAALNEYREAVFTEIERLAPEKDIPELFRTKYDYHNAKVLIKAEGAGSSADELMSDSGRVPAARLKELYTEERYAQLPGKLGTAMQEAKNVLARTANPQLADFTLDRAWFEEQGELAGKSGNSFLQAYVRLLTDTANLKAVVRTLRMGRSADFLREVLLSGGNTDMAKLLSVTDGESLKAAFSGTCLRKAAEAGAEALQGGGLTRFERECDNAVNAELKKAKTVSYGSEPVTAYLAAVENEITAVRMILTGKLSGIPAEVLRERLRELYV